MSTIKKMACTVSLEDRNQCASALPLTHLSSGACELVTSPPPSLCELLKRANEARLVLMLRQMKQSPID